MSSPRQDVALLDTSVVIDLDFVDETRLPIQTAIAALTLAELSMGIHTTSDPVERAARLTRLQAIESSYDPIPFEAAAARQYGHLAARVIAAGQNPRPRRLDLMIASTAYVNGLALYTRNPKDFAALTEIMSIVAV